MSKKIKSASTAGIQTASQRQEAAGSRVTEKSAELHSVAGMTRGSQTAPQSRTADIHTTQGNPVQSGVKTAQTASGAGRVQNPTQPQKTAQGGNQTPYRQNPSGGLKLTGEQTHANNASQAVPFVASFAKSPHREERSLTAGAAKIESQSFRQTASAGRMQTASQQQKAAGSRVTEKSAELHSVAGMTRGSQTAPQSRTADIHTTQGNPVQSGVKTAQTASGAGRVQNPTQPQKTAQGGNQTNKANVSRGVVGGAEGAFGYRKLTKQQLSDKAFNVRVEQLDFADSYSLKDIKTSWKLEGKASFFEATAKYKQAPIPVKTSVENGFGKAGKAVVGVSTATFASRGDMADDMAAGVVLGGSLAYGGWKLAQNASPIVITAVSKTGQTAVKVIEGTADVVKTAGKAVQVAAGTANFAMSAFVPFNSRLTKNVFMDYARNTGLLNTKTTQAILRGVKGVQTKTEAVVRTTKQMKTAVVNTAKATVKGAKAVGNASVTAAKATVKTAVVGYRVVRGVVKGNVSFAAVNADMLKKLSAVTGKARLAAMRGIKTSVPALGRGMNVAGRKVVNGAVKGGVWAKHKGVPAVGKLGAKGALTVGGLLMTSDDMMLRGTGGAMMLSVYGVKTSVVAGRIAKESIKTGAKAGIKTGKTTVKAVKYARSRGVRAAWERAKQKAWEAIQNAAGSMVAALVDFIKVAGRKVVVPIILIAALVVGTMSVFSGPTLAVGTIFSGLFDKKGEDGVGVETDIRAFLTDPSNPSSLTNLRNQYINSLYDKLHDNLAENGGDYDYVRLKTNQSDGVIDCTIEGISGEFYTLDELTNIIQPIYNSLLLKDYGLEPTDAQAKAAIEELFNKLFKQYDEATIEWCGQDAADGSGEPNSEHTCGRIHALPDCPNIESGVHASYTCPSCCEQWYECDGHKGSRDCGESAHSHGSSCYDSTGGLTCTRDEHSHDPWRSASNPGCYSTTYHYGYLESPCSNCTYYFECSGYEYCAGHDVLTVTLSMDGLYQLLAEYFTDPIDSLSNLASRTEEQEDELQELKDNYEICLELVSQVSILYGGGLTMDDLSGVTWVDGTRIGCQEVVDLALSQVGQVGGQPYWSYYGFSSRVAWCGCFVHWVMNTSGHGTQYAQSANNAYTPTLVAWFQDEGRWGSRSFRDLCAGDTIFFDWEGDGGVDHIGIVIGRDDDYVYTVEGNSGDAVKCKQYDLNSVVILGYGLMNY